jgi:hypothetical protein
MGLLLKAVCDCMSSSLVLDEPGFLAVVIEPLLTTMFYEGRGGAGSCWLREAGGSTRYLKACLPALNLSSLST